MHLQVQASKERERPAALLTHCCAPPYHAPCSAAFACVLRALLSGRTVKPIKHVALHQRELWPSGLRVSGNSPLPPQPQHLLPPCGLGFAPQAPKTLSHPLQAAAGRSSSYACIPSVSLPDATLLRNLELPLPTCPTPPPGPNAGHSAPCNPECTTPLASSSTGTQVLLRCALGSAGGCWQCCELEDGVAGVDGGEVPGGCGARGRVRGTSGLDCWGRDGGRRGGSAAACYALCGTL